MEDLAYALHWAGAHELTVLFGSFGVTLLLSLLAARKGGKWWGLSTLGGLLVAFAFLNIFLSHLWVVPLIDRVAQSGRGVVTEVRGTNIRYNDQPVLAYDVLLRTQDGRTVEGELRSDSFLLVPRPEQGWIYPRAGLEFTARHLPRHPEAFYVVTNDDSPYARELGCGEATKEMGAAKVRFEFSPTDASAQSAYADALERFIESCVQEENGAKMFRQQLEELRR